MLRSWLVWLARSRGCFFVIEQPLNSVMYKFPHVADIITLAGARRYTTCLAAFGGRHMKLLELHGTVPEEPGEKMHPCPES